LIVLLNGARFDDPITEMPSLGATEMWNLINLTGDAHPIHLHLVQFQVLNRQRFNTKKYAPGTPLTYTGKPAAPPATETGWKDTVTAYPGEVTRIITRFDHYRGVYPYHCHILEHEDNEMMRRFAVV
jgi:spore coat protein A